MNVEFLEALEEMAKEEGLERDELYDAVRKGLAMAYREQFGTEDEVDVEIDRSSGDITIVDKGESVEFDVTQLGRIATRRAEETIRQEILKRRRQMVYERFHARVGELINGSVHRFEGRDVWLNLGQAEALMPDGERIPGEHYRPGQTLRTYLYRVEETQGDPRVLVSRAHPDFVRRLMELEVPEVEQGLVEVVAVAREPGVRAKAAVRARTPEIEPVGTCVGSSGARVRQIVRELSGEKIDIIRWSESLEELIQNSLEPATVMRIELDEDEKHATVIVPDGELSLAIGKGGQNVRLTAKLTGWHIDATSPNEIAKETAEGEETEAVEAQPTEEAEATDAEA